MRRVTRRIPEFKWLVAEKMLSYMWRVWMAGMLALVAAGCSSTGEVSGGNGTIRIRDGVQPAGTAPTQKFAASIRVLPYADARNIANPRKLGIGGSNIYGLNAPKGDDILLDRDAAAVVTSAMKRRLKDAGYQVVEDGSANFEMSGTVNELTYNVKSRDEVAIAVATELKDSSSGKVLWSGVVAEKKDRFAGVAGNDISDVASFLQQELGVVTKKTSDAIGAILMAQRPELFNLSPGTKPIAGVTVLKAPGVNAPSAASSVAPALQAASAKGVLTISTNPSRAKIYVGDVYYGLSPLRLELEPGIVEVSARVSGYKNAAEKVSVRTGETTEVELTLKK